MTGVYDPSLGVMRYDLDESIATQESLKDAQKTKPAPHSDTLAAFMKLDPKRAKLTPKHIDDLQKALRAHHSDGVGDNVASGNRDGLKNNAAHNSGSLGAIKKDFKKYAVGCSEDFPDKLMEHYIECTEAGARNVILELLSNNPELRLAFASPETLDQVSELTYHIDQLEQSILHYEAENAELKEDAARAEMEAMYEDILYQSSAPAQRRRRSLDTDFDAPSEDNRALYEEAPRSHLDPAMAKRASYLNSTAGRTDVVRDKNYLTETWDLQRKI